MPPPTKLSELPEGSSAVIESLLSGRSSLTRLRELGLVPGTRVRIVRRAPLGEPIEISVRGSMLAMRNQDAAHISITSVTP
jgi:ferrous iron transport protein A